MDTPERKIKNNGGPPAPTSPNGSTDISINPWNGSPLSQRYYDMLETRKTLPVWQKKEEFLKVFNANQVVVLLAETDSGKSSQIPQFVLETLEADSLVACTQPHSVAAMSVSQRVAYEMDVTIGEEVGFSVRFKDCTSAKTVLKYLTDYMLLREAMTTPFLERYKVIIVDEVHERTMATDVLLGLLKQLILSKRPDMKLVVMSRTLEEAKDFQRYFDNPPLITVPSMLYPVEIVHMEKPQEDYLLAAIDTVIQIHKDQDPGDIILFLASEEMIEEACCLIKAAFSDMGDTVGPVEVLPLHSTLPPAMQQKFFDPAPPPLVEGGPAGRKIVVATDITETSLTIDGIVYVIDPGFATEKLYDPVVRAEFLLVSPISKATADQRSRRAGRTQPGKCYRLYTKRDHQPHTYPEALRSNLANTVLTLKKVGIDDVAHFDYKDPPAPATLMRALDDLHDLGALDEEGNLTELGQIMSEFPLDPQMAKMIVGSPEFNCSNEILSISAMLSVPDCFVRTMEAQDAANEARRRFIHRDGDHLTLLNVYNAYKVNNGDVDPNWCNENYVNQEALKSADNVRQELVRIMNRLNLELCSTASNSPNYYVNIRKAMLAGYFMQVAHLRSNGDYMTARVNQVVDLIYPSNSYDQVDVPDWVIYNEHIFTDRNFIRSVTFFPWEWLLEIAPDYYDWVRFPYCEAAKALAYLRIFKFFQVH